MKTYKEHRYINNPKEKEIVEEFITEHSKREDMDLIIFGHSSTSMIPNQYLTNKEKRIILSTIQWLGSPVGQEFLNSVGFKLQPEIKE